MAVVVVPGGFVFVSGVVGDQLLQDGFEVVFDEAGFEFDGGECGGGTDDETVEEAVAFFVAEVFGELRNIRDRDHVGALAVRDVAASDAAILQPGAPRSAYVGLRVRF